MRQLACACLLFLFAQTPFANAQDKPTTASKPEEVKNSLGMKLVLIPAGEFMMGGGEAAKSS